jgi:hypothetical protein
MQYFFHVGNQVVAFVDQYNPLSIFIPSLIIYRGFGHYTRHMFPLWSRLLLPLIIVRLYDTINNNLIESHTSK